MVETIALYVGYICLSLFSLAVIIFLINIIIDLLIEMYNIIKLKRMIKLFKKSRNKNVYKCSLEAYNYLMSHKFKEKDTLGEVKRQIDLFKEIEEI